MTMRKEQMPTSIIFILFKFFKINIYIIYIYIYRERESDIYI